MQTLSRGSLGGPSHLKTVDSKNFDWAPPPNRDSHPYRRITACPGENYKILHTLRSVIMNVAIQRCLHEEFFFDPFRRFYFAATCRHRRPAAAAAAAENDQPRGS